MYTVDAWRKYGTEPVRDARSRRYAMLYSWWDGTWRDDPYVIGQERETGQPALYRNTRKMWSDSEAIVAFYEQYVYPGPLSRDGEPLPDGTRGAIPIDPDTGSEATDAALVRAISTLFAMGNWSQYKSYRPRMGAILGDLLTELVDDVEHGTVRPRDIWPGHVVDLELDDDGNVKRYAFEEPIRIAASTAYGQTVKAESYLYRKEVDGEAIRHYRDGRPAAFPELGITEAVEENIYGFVPAIWDRHQIVPGDRGRSAIEPTLRQALEYNSILSHALDYQRKQFAAPVGVIGRATRNRTLTMPGGISLGSNPTPEEILASRRQAAENLNLIDLQEGGQFVSINFDVGKTRDILEPVLDSMLAEAPEARFGQEILKMTQVTGPGIKRALGPILGRLEAPQANYDAQTVKQLQMMIAIIGERLRRGDYPEAVVQARPDRYDAFAPYDLTSYGYGTLNFAIGPRDPFPETEDERVARLVLIESLTSSWAKREAGVPEEEIAAQQREAEAARREMAQAFSVAGTGGQEQEDGAREQEA